MPNQDHLSTVVSALAVFSTLAKTKAKQAVIVASMLLIPFTCLAQNRDQDDHQPQITPPSSQSSSQTTTSSTAQPSTVTIPAGTRFALVLTNPVSSKTMHRGDVVYAQTTAPVTVGDQVLIPAGTFVQGKVDKLTRNGNRAEMLMTSAKVVFPDGYVANIAGPLNVASDEGTAWRDPGDGAKAGAILAPDTWPIASLGVLEELVVPPIHSTQSATLGGTTICSSSLGLRRRGYGTGRRRRGDVRHSPPQSRLLRGRRLTHGNDSAAAASLIRESGCGCRSTSSGAPGRSSHARSAPAAVCLRSRHVLHPGHARHAANHHSRHAPDRRQPRHARHRHPRHTVDSGNAVSVSLENH